MNYEQRKIAKRTVRTGSGKNIITGGKTYPVDDRGRIKGDLGTFVKITSEKFVDYSIFKSFLYKLINNFS